MDWSTEVENDRLHSELEKLKKEKNQKQFQFESLENLLQKKEYEIKEMQQQINKNQQENRTLLLEKIDLEKKCEESTRVSWASRENERRG